MKVRINPVRRTVTARSRRSISAAVWLLGILICSGTPLQAGKRVFTVASDVALSHFGGRTSLDDDPFVFSPNRRFFVVSIEHGRLDLSRPESILRIYRTGDITRILKERQGMREPSPLWEIRKSTYRHGPIVSRVRWLRDSSGVAFLAKTALGNNQLLLADLRTKIVHELTGADQYVTGFDIRTRYNFVYTVLAQPREESPNLGLSAIVGTGKNLDSLMFPQDLRSPENLDRSELWAVASGRRFKLKDPASGRPLTTYYWSGRELALSPDGRSVVTVLPLDVVPAEWEKLYPPPPVPYGSSRVRAGRQDLQDPHGWGLVEEYVLIDLLSGKVHSLVGAPSAMSAAWWSLPSVDWSSDGQSVALSGVFTPGASMRSVSNSPCVAVLRIGSRQVDCLESIYGAAEDDKLKWHIITKARFAPGSDKRVIIDSLWPGDEGRTVTYTRVASNSWRRDTSGIDKNRDSPFDLSIKQSLNDPPVLLATDNGIGVSHIVWDPNLQLRDIALGEVSIFRWTNRNGHDDVGGLFKPPDYVPGRRYPLVIQTHGFVEDQFIPSGAFPTAFAAQELAALGIVVLQVRGEACSVETFNTPDEAPCAVANYEAAAKELVKAGIADPNNLGIIGFSRTCYYVLEELTAGALHFKAAAITDGVDYGYLQYLENVDLGENLFAREANVIIGSPPFGEGFTLWLKRSPGFKMDRVETPLQVVALDNHQSLREMWQTYANLRYLRKPVDLMIIPGSEHVMTNPRERMISQGSTVDWFRFWLKGEEDSDPGKASQYSRWRELRQSVRR
jgi:hypothetical protein